MVVNGSKKEEDVLNITVEDCIMLVPLGYLFVFLSYIISFFIKEKPVSDIAEEQIKMIHKDEVTWWKMRRREY